MDFSKESRSRWLGVGLGVFSIGLAIGAAMLVLGWSGDRMQSRSREAQGPSAPGAIPAERHKNIATVAAR